MRPADWAAWLEMARLLLHPPALFHHLHGLDWYRHALWEALRLAPADLAATSCLEIGCATGDFCGGLAAQGARVHGIDRSPDMVRRARQAHPGVRFTEADALALPFGESGFDIVYAASLLNVVDDPVRVLREMARVCRPAGVLVILVPVEGFGTAQARRWTAAQALSPREAAAYMAWHRLARKIPAARLQQWVDEAGIGHARVQAWPLLGGMVQAAHVRLMADGQRPQGTPWPDAAQQAPQNGTITASSWV
ncbi:class I SAM-dependent methyltransferase [Delftia sp. PS-11]|uniref:class I SAM-dependent methyltransferase n=1 Tax=Delftia sp. PS-11 TaxID=2767222 RepID=UPI0024562DB3|nr:methyltransferase domain-containing protein [Delftia sp. PS-11]KAJ8743547.1 methyltransferase domain-containing protein [Delftia sp. PS-11]